jgi:hypothetical protein
LLTKEWVNLCRYAPGFWSEHAMFWTEWAAFGYQFKAGLYQSHPVYP